jgi:hypothetical protein
MDSIITGSTLLFLTVVVLFFGFVGYVILKNFLALTNRKTLARAFSAAPVIKKDGPILIQGSAFGPDLLLPTNGEHVAFFGLFVLS